MSIKIRCNCGRTLLVPTRKAGATIRCPKCAASLLVPSSGTIEAAPGVPQSDGGGGQLRDSAEQAAHDQIFGSEEHLPTAPTASRSIGHPKVKTPVKASVETPVKASVETPVETPAKPSAKTPVKTPAAKLAAAPPLPVQSAPPKRSSAPPLPPVKAPPLPAPPALPPGDPTGPSPPQQKQKQKQEQKQEQKREAEGRPSDSRPLDRAPVYDISATTRRAEIAEPPLPATPHSEPSTASPRETLSAALEPPAPPAAEPAPPLPSTSRRPLVRGVEPSLERLLAVWQLAAWVAALGLFSSSPALWALFRLFQQESGGAPRWVYALLLVGVVQFAYAAYVARLPDWSAVWVVAVMLLVISCGHAVLLASTLFGSASSSLVAKLDLHDQMGHGRAAAWCLILLSVTSLLAFFTGRMAARWQILDDQLRRARSGGGAS